MRTTVACLLVLCLAASSLLMLPSKTACCCRAFCTMKTHCEQRSCIIGRADQSKQVLALSIFPIAEAPMTTEFVVANIGAFFEILPPQHLLSRPSPPEPPPPRV